MQAKFLYGYSLGVLAGLDLQARLDLINRLRRDVEERHAEALQALDRQLREEKERHQDIGLSVTGKWSRSCLILSRNS
jgi:hypothetical protein